ncbi:MAG: 1-acyl-sn-glycerol-3-phosphate acyltransferase [Rhodocyclales bacterium]|nr:1-acyl-sn-glycerol-3-phosphate acyltransferase [Rhodocyclales bacterium]
MRRTWRGLRLTAHVVEGALVTLCVYPFIATATRGKLRQRWSRRLLRCLGVELQAQGAAVPPGSLIVANHVSWLDVFVINALVPSAFVAKAEVRRWPLIGWLAARNDTVFLQRGNRGHAGVVNREIGSLLGGERNVTVFPEGTTSDGTQVLHFHAALLQPAITSGRIVQPLALSYRTPAGTRCHAPVYDGEVTLGQSLARILAAPRIIARTDIVTPVPDATGRHRRELAAQLRDAIVARIVPQGEPKAGAANPPEETMASRQECAQVA